MIISVQPLALLNILEGKFYMFSVS